jgi:hypothetical protein
MTHGPTATASATASATHLVFFISIFIRDSFIDWTFEISGAASPSTACPIALTLIDDF